MYIEEIINPMGHGFKITQTIDNKSWQFKVSDNGHDADTIYNYRAVVKCKAGFLTISEGKNTMRFIASNWQKNAVQTIQIENQYGNWETVLALKGNRFYIIDLAIIESLKVSDIHTSFPKMADQSHWKSIGSKTWADLAYGPLSNTTARFYAL